MCLHDNAVPSSKNCHTEQIKLSPVKLGNTLSDTGLDVCICLNTVFVTVLWTIIHATVIIKARMYVFILQALDRKCFDDLLMFHLISETEM
jgi:hypothetical protein